MLENTISAADNALKHGFHGVEFDLRADKNSHPWMMHDATLGRVTGDPNGEVNQAARISNCSAEDGFGLKAYLACRLRIM
ncbi:glycerophosphodiester phosphodiesterase family protein [Mesorhizobium sp. M0859]|uniref:glycerophosphodiester phosphodiesterase family protein n=1 Tax=Mesorhizobium sp. M0859 TaxID=2957014 RepID=UPI00333585C2